MALTLAVVAAVAAALANAAAAYLQQGSAKRLSGRGGVGVRQLGTLLERPRWIAGQACDIAAFLLQALALSTAALIFVEPLLVLALPFAILLRTAALRRPPPRRSWVGTACCVVGLATFLVVARPSSARALTMPLEAALPLAGGLAVALAAVLTAARLTGGNRRAVCFALAAGACYGVTAGLVKVAIGQLGQGLLVVLTHWSLYATVVTGIGGVFLMQSALKVGALAAPVAVLMVTDPLVSIGVGLGWLGERISSSPVAVGLEVATLALMTAGLAVLARESELLAAPAEGAGDRDESSGRRAGRSR